MSDKEKIKADKVNNENSKIIKPLLAQRFRGYFPRCD